MRILPEGDFDSSKRPAHKIVAEGHTEYTSELLQGRVLAFELLHLIQQLVLETVYRIVEGLVYVDNIDQEAEFIELVTLDPQFYIIFVSVRLVGFAEVTAGQVVTGRDAAFNCNRVDDEPPSSYLVGQHYLYCLAGVFVQQLVSFGAAVDRKAVRDQFRGLVPSHESQGGVESTGLVPARSVIRADSADLAGDQADAIAMEMGADCDAALLPCIP